MDYYDKDQNRDPFSPGNSYRPGGEPPHGDQPDNGGQTRPKKRKSSGKGPLKVIVLCLVCAVLGATIQPLYRQVSGDSETTLYVGDREPTQVTLTAVDTGKEMTTAEIYAAYVGSSVGITVDIVSTNIFGQTVKNAAAGSGFVITEDGYILTNYHVINGASAITVAFSDGTTYPATVIGGEEDNDIAVIKIEAEGLTPVVLGSSSDMLVGEQVTTIGNPLGELTFSQTTGIISALDRSITMTDGSKMNVLQTDCAINSGNSGGPLFNNHGEVIGIVCAKYSSSAYSSSASVEGLGFAIPMDDVADMVSDLVSAGYVTGKPLLGIRVDDVDEAVHAYGVPDGAAVVIVTPGLAADKAGLQAGDIVTKINETEVTSSAEFIEAKDAYEVGDTVTLTVFRAGELITLDVTLEESTPEKEAQQEQALREYEKQRQQEQQQQQNDAYSGNGGFGGFWPFGFGFGY